MALHLKDGLRFGSLVAALAVVGVLAGCNTSPGQLRTEDGRVVQTIQVDKTDAAESAAVTELLSAEADYKQALKVLQAYYQKTGAVMKQDWARNELQNISKARWFNFEGMTAPVVPETQSIEDANEPGFAEQVLSARRRWLAAVEALDQIYQAKGLTFQSRAISRVRERFDPILSYDYFLTAEIPPETLRPTEVVTAADALFAKALALYKEGKIAPLVVNYRKERQALLLFRQMVDQYPTSTKIAHAAYYIGEIYKEYFNEDQRAVRWYERSWQWDPHSTLPVRFQAAVTYDYRLTQRAKALELYHAVLKFESYDSTNVYFSQRRIKELTGKEVK